MIKKFIVKIFILSFILVILNNNYASAKTKKIEDSLQRSGQLILVVPKTWNSLQAKIYLFEKKNSDWKQYGKKIQGVIGKKGLAWGIGIHHKDIIIEKKKVFKKEGDGKAPAGIFTIGKAMGYSANKIKNSSLEYMQVTFNHHGVDDPKSEYYNKIINIKKLDKHYTNYYKSHEKMRRKDSLYKWLFLINHNTKNIPGKGSLIFFHVWRNKNKGTAGCTAVSEKNILKILKWIDKDNNPILIQVPERTYQKISKKYNLPVIK